MRFQKLPLDRASEATGTIVVIDVLRAFSTAAYAFSRGAKSIFPVASVQAAFSLREKDPSLLIMGEENWFPVPGFDFSNSPADFLSVDLTARSLIQRTTAGTQGLLRIPPGNPTFAASFLCAAATVAAIHSLNPDSVTFILTGTAHGNPAEEDDACADYLIALIKNESPSPDPYLERIKSSHAGHRFLDPQDKCYSPHDMELCTVANLFPFAMRLELPEKIPTLLPVRER